MDTHPSNARNRELVALRVNLNEALTTGEIRSVNWATVAKAAGPALARGWTGVELARWAIGEIGDRTESVGAVIVSAVRDMGAVDPPREATPAPPPVRDVLADMYGRNTAAASAQQWAERIRAGITA